MLVHQKMALFLEPEQRAWARLPNSLAYLEAQLGLARKHLSDLSVLDLHLRQMSMNEVLHRLQGVQRANRIPVIMLSAVVTAGQIQRRLQSGASAYLTTPLDGLLDKHSH